MTSAQRHTIGKQFFDLHFNGSERGAMNLQAAVSELNRLGVTPKIERVLDRYAADGSVVRIDRLEVDAGAVPLEEIEERLPAMIAEALDKALAEIATPDAELSFGSPDQPAGRRMSEDEAAVDALLIFLRHGTLPATFRPRSHQAFEAQLIEAWHRPDLAKQTIAALESPIARQRLLAQFSRQGITTLLDSLMPDALKIIDDIIEKIGNSAHPADLMTRLEQRLLDQALELAVERKQLDSGQVRQTLLAVATSLPELAQSSRTETANRQHLTKTRAAKTPSTSDSSTVRTTTERSAKSGKARSSDRETADRDLQQTRADKLKAESNAPETSSLDLELEKAENRPGTPDQPSGTTTPPKRRQDSDKTAQEAATEHPDERDGLYVDNAGLVLLHPFLPQYFKALKVATDEELRQPDRALRLLHYLATGLEQTPEYELVLPKILCGLAPGSLAGPMPRLTDKEREESKALLSAVTRHWDALKNTGTEALRETYLKRNGKLTRWHDGGWLLQVESKSFDILLDSLPWGISMIKLPWMPRMLRVEWFAQA